MKSSAWRAIVGAIVVTASLVIAVPRAEAVAPGAASLNYPSGSGYNPVNFSWTAVSTATDYYLWVKNLGTGSNVVTKWYSAFDAGCGAGAGDCVVNKPASFPAGNYRWWVQTWNSDGYGPWSSPLNFTVELPGKPAIVYPAAGQSTEYETLTWQKVAGATYYQVWVDKAGTGTNVWNKWYKAGDVGCGDGGPFPAFDCSLSLPLPAGTYTAWVKAWSPAGYGPWSDSRTFTFTPPPATTTISPSGTGTPNPTYSWNFVASSTWYYLWVSKGGTAVIKQWYNANDLHGPTFTSCSAIAPCSVSPPTTLSSGTYTWWVQTWSAAGTGPWSASKTFTVS